MGGNAFGQLDRMSSEFYNSMVDKLIGGLDLPSGYRAAIPASYANKETHGDIDVLVSERNAIIYLMSNAARNGLETMGTKQSTSGLNVLFSYEGQQFQVDFNLSGSNFDFAYGYFSYNDLGNLIGRITYRQGLKFGHDGLWYIHRRGDRVVTEVLLTSSFFEALEFLGFDVERWQDGFDDLTDIFDYVISSKFFEGSAYPLEHRNHKARTRDRKRKTYTAFLKYLEDKGIDTTWKPANKNVGLNRAMQRWSHVAEKIAEAEFQMRINDHWKLYFGGDRVMSLTGVTGKDLGQLMTFIKRCVPKDEHIFNMTTTRADVIIADAYWKIKEARDE